MYDRLSPPNGKFALDGNYQDVVDHLLSRYSYYSLRGLLLFGSNARSNGNSPHDLDLIFLTQDERLCDDPLYQRTVNESSIVDFNIIQENELDQLLKEPSWQYRFLDSIILLTPPVDRHLLVRWHSCVRAWIRTTEARHFRLAKITERIKFLLSYHSSVRKSQSSIINTATLTHILRFVLFAIHELHGQMPFEQGNPINTAVDLVGSTLIRRILAKTPRDERDNDLWKTMGNDLYRFHFALESVYKFCAPIMDESLAMQCIGIESPTFGKLLDESDYFSYHWDPRNASTLLGYARELCDRPRKLTGYRHSAIRFRGVSKRKTSRQNTKPRVIQYDPQGRRLKVILSTGGCRVRSCIFCELPSLAANPVATLDKFVLPDLELESAAIYTDGSFFDDDELTESARIELINLLTSRGIKSLNVETLPRFLNHRKIEAIYNRLGTTHLNVSVGIQSTDDTIRRDLLAVPISHEDVAKCFNLRNEYGFALRIYLMLGKPLLTIDEDLKDLLDSLQTLSHCITPNDHITINRMLLTNNTIVTKLFHKGLFHCIDICRLRYAVDRARQMYPRLNIWPGTVTTNTCTSRDDRMLDGCVCCNAKMCAEEQHHFKSAAACSNPQLNTNVLPWTIMGDMPSRIAFARRVIGSK